MLTAAALISCTPHHHKGNKHTSAPKALYFMTNNAAGNSIIALPIGLNGTLSAGSTTATGGKGGSELDAKTKLPNAPDALSSQGSVRVVANV